MLRILWRNPVEAWSEAHFKNEIVVEKFGFRRVFVVSEPRAIRHVLLDNADNYEKDRLQVRVLSAGLKGGLLTANGRKWWSQRRLIAPIFSPSSIQNLSPMMRRSLEEMAIRWQHQDGSVLSINDEMTRLTFDALSQTIFAGCLEKDAEYFRNAITAYFETVGRIDPLDILGAPDWLPRVTHFKAARLLRQLDEGIEDAISRRRNELLYHARPKDLLGQLIAGRDPDAPEEMNRQELRANILTFIAAGQETTGHLLAWCLYLLSQSHEWRSKVSAEAAIANDEPLDIKRLPTTRAVINETMRLYPPISAISRAAVGHDDLLGHRINPGEMVVISPYVLHRHRLLWDRPDSFEPQRFLLGASPAQDRFKFLPFGTGPHTCVGAQFALHLAALVLPRLARNFNLAVPHGHRVWPCQRMTLRPDGGLPMRVTKRD